MDNYYEDFPNELFAINGMIQNRAELLRSLLLKQKSDGKRTAKTNAEKKELVVGICNAKDSELYTLAEYFMDNHGDHYYDELHKLILRNAKKPNHYQEYTNLERMRQLAGLDTLMETARFKFNRIKIKDIFDGYDERGESGLFAYGGKLNIRPAFQREFIYKPHQKEKVIESLLKGRRIGLMYWIENPDKTYDLLDGQQRTTSICQFINNEYSFNGDYYHSLPKNKQDFINETELYIDFVQNADPNEIIEIFEDINFSGDKLTRQEIRNAAYAGKGGWLEDAKEYFSTNTGPGALMSEKFVNGKPIRQEVLEIAIQWVANSNNDISIRDYMAKHCVQKEASELKRHFKNVIYWIRDKFKNDENKHLKTTDWNKLYRMEQRGELNPIFKKDADIPKIVSELMSDPDIKHSKVYEYIFTGDARLIHDRTFSDSIKQAVFQKQGKKCALCGDKFRSIKGMEADHIKPWSDGGSSSIENCRMLCADCNRKISDKNRYREDPHNTNRPSMTDKHPDHPDHGITEDPPISDILSKNKVKPGGKRGGKGGFDRQFLQREIDKNKKDNEEDDTSTEPYNWKNPPNNPPEIPEPPKQSRKPRAKPKTPKGSYDWHNPPGSDDTNEGIDPKRLRVLAGLD